MIGSWKWWIFLIVISWQCFYVQTCSAKRKRRSVNNEKTWGPGDLDSIHTITLGPISRIRITEITRNETKTTYVETVEEFPHFPEDIWSNTREKQQGNYYFWGKTSEEIVSGRKQQISLLTPPSVNLQHVAHNVEELQVVGVTMLQSTTLLFYVYPYHTSDETNNDMPT